MAAPVASEAAAAEQAAWADSAAAAVEDLVVVKEGEAAARPVGSPS
jgi:hypothetical protein